LRPAALGKSQQQDGHPSSHCPLKDNNNQSVASVASSVKKLQKEIKSMKKKCTAANTQLQVLREEESDLSGSDGGELATSHFQHGAFQFAQVEEIFEAPISKLFQQRHTKCIQQMQGTKAKLDLQEIMLLDSQSTVDLFCNEELIGETSKSCSDLTLHSNGGTMAITKKAKMPGCHASVWLNK